MKIFDGSFEAAKCTLARNLLKGTMNKGNENAPDDLGDFPVELRG